MAYEQKPGQGALFRNDKKGNEKAPDYRGSANINGITVEIAGWIKSSPGKMAFMSLSVKEKKAQATAKDAEEIFDDDRPF